MKKARPCSVCERITARLLFKDKVLDIPICSKKCEYDYLESLAPDDKAQMDVIRRLDEKIAENKKRKRIGWWASGFGVVLIGGGFVIASVTLFIVGNAIVVFGTLSTRHFEYKIDKLTRLRKRIAI